MSSLHNKNVVILGASSGIGASLAEYFSAQGANVGIYGRRAERLQEVVAKCSGTVHSAPCDATDVTQVASISLGFLDKFGSLDVWVNCVGQNKAIGNTWELSPDLLWEEVSVDLKSCINGTHTALQQFVKANQGIILNFCGGGTLKPHLYASAYSSAKTAIARFTEAVFLELQEAQSQVEIYATNPGLVQNERTNLLCTDPNSRKYMPEIERAFQTKGGEDPLLTGYLLEYALEGKLKAWNGRLVLPFDLTKFDIPPQGEEGFLR